MTKFFCGPLWKEDKKWENVGYVLYSFHDYPHALYIALGAGGGSQGERQPPLLGSGAAPRRKLFWCADPLISGPTHVLCMILHMVLGYDGFRPLVFCKSGQGNYGYVLIQG